MAKARVYKKMGTVGMELPECPVCLEVMSAPIYNCQSGHSLCGICTSNLCPSICPICRQPMTQIRNRALEDIISKAKVPCPNKDSGCIYTLAAQDIDDHIKECIFREIDCPHGAVFGKCSWHGKTKDMFDHFKNHHPENCNISTDSDVELDNVSVTDDDRHIFLVAQAKLLFVLTVKIDTIQKMAYWILQHIGSKNIAQQHVYEIHVISQQDSRRKILFFEYCFNDTMKPDEIFRQGRCGIMPLNMLKHFIQDKKIVFRFSLKRIPANHDQKSEKPQSRAQSQGPSGLRPQGVGPRGPGPRGPGPRGSGPRGPGHRNPRPRGPRPKSPGFNQDGHRSPSVAYFNNQHPFNFKD